MEKLRKEAAILNFQERIVKTFLDFFLWPTYLLNEQHFIWNSLSHNRSYTYLQRFIVSLILSTIWYISLSVIFFNIFNGINNFLNSKNEIRKIKEEEQFYQRKHPFSLNGLNGLTRSTKDTLYSRGGFLNSNSVVKINFYLPNYINFEGQLIDLNILELDPIFLYIRAHKLINCIYLKDGLGLEQFFQYFHYNYKIPFSDGSDGSIIKIKMSSKVNNISRRLTRRIVKIMKSEYSFFIFGTLILGLLMEYLNLNLIAVGKTPIQVHRETELIRSAKAPIELVFPVQKSAVTGQNNKSLKNKTLKNKTLKNKTLKNKTIVSKTIGSKIDGSKIDGSKIEKSEEKGLKSKEIKKRKFNRKFNRKIHRLSDLAQEQNQIEEYQEFESPKLIKSDQRKIVPKIR